MTTPDLARGVSYFILMSLFVFSLPQTGFCQGQRTEAQEERNRPAEKKEDDESFVRRMTTMLEEHPVTLFGNRHLIHVLPLAYYDFRTGINLGFRALLLSGTNKDYEYKLTLQLLASSRGSHKHKLFFLLPSLAGSKFGIHFRGEWERDLEARYFGTGNNSRYEERLTDEDSQDYIHEDYYLYNLKRPRFTIHGTYEILPDVRLWLGYGFQSVDPQLKSGELTSFLGSEQPFGHRGGSGQHLSFKLVWDTRLPRVFPKFGFLTEVSVEPNYDSVREEILSAGTREVRNRAVSYTRYTFSTAHFLSINPRLIFANRLAFETITGDPPYYAFGEFGTIRQTRAIGGSQSLRGFQSRRFQDKVKFITLTELRYHLWEFEFFSQPFDLIVMGFFDNGRVWSSMSEFSFDGFHKTYGMGVWVNWNKNLLVRLDVGRSPEQIIPYFRINAAF